MHEVYFILIYCWKLVKLSLNYHAGPGELTLSFIALLEDQGSVLKIQLAVHNDL